MSTTALTRSNIRGFLEKAADVAALPAGMTVERLAKGTLIAVQNQPKLLGCSQESLMTAVIEAGQLGLEPGGVMSEAYIVPYGEKAQFQIGYRGFRKLAYRSGWMIEAEVVRDGDEFSFRKGLAPDLAHVPRLDTKDRSLTHVYAIAWPLNGQGRPTFEVMSREQVEHIREKSRAKNDGPWVTDFDEMARKTVVKRLGKILPLDPTAERAIEYDNRADVGRATWSDVDPDTNEIGDGNGAPSLPASTSDLNAMLDDGGSTPSDDNGTSESASTPASEEGVPPDALPEEPGWDLPWPPTEPAATVEQQKKALQKIQHVETLRKLLAKEKLGENRVGSVDAIEARIRAVSDSVDEPEEEDEDELMKLDATYVELRDAFYGDMPEGDGVIRDRMLLDGPVRADAKKADYEKAIAILKEKIAAKG